MSNKVKSILLIGTGSLLNYGCEAIVQGTYVILKRFLPDYQIYLASDDLKYDAKLLPKDIKLIRYKKRFTLYRIYKGVLRRFLHIGIGSAVRMNTNIGNKFDIVLSCGGDNFCEAPDGTLYNLLLDLKTIGDNCIKRQKKYCLWGSSVGPFINPANEKFVIGSLNKYTALFVRERKSYDYLSQFDIVRNKLKLVADPAFCMQKEDVCLDKNPEDVYIGINVSLLALGSTVWQMGGGSNDFCERMFCQLDKILMTNDRIKFLCIPHVLSDIGGPQDDYSFMLRYVERTKFKERVVLLPKYLGAKKTKGYISHCDLLVAARMHCCVGGISTATPTLFLTYSNKGVGMAEYAYGHHKYDMPFNEIVEDKFISVINSMLNDKNEIHQHLLNRQEAFYNDAMSSGAVLSQIISK